MVSLQRMLLQQGLGLGLPICAPWMAKIVISCCLPHKDLELSPDGLLQGERSQRIGSGATGSSSKEMPCTRQKQLSRGGAPELGGMKSKACAFNISLKSKVQLFVTIRDFQV